MRKYKLVGLIVCWTLSLAYTFASEGAIPSRRSSGQIYQLIEKYRLSASKPASERKRRSILAGLRAQLQQELSKGLKYNDSTLYLVNRALLQVTYIVKNDCAKARQLLVSGTTGSDPSTEAEKQRDRESREGLYLYQSVCR
jgi:hypothetical protein